MLPTFVLLFCLSIRLFNLVGLIGLLACLYVAWLAGAGWPVLHFDSFIWLGCFFLFVDMFSYFRFVIFVCGCEQTNPYLHHQ